MINLDNLEVFHDLRWVTRWRAMKPYIWQMQLLDAKGLATYTKARGINYSEINIRQLWQLGLLRADLIKSQKRLSIKRFSEVGTDRLGNFLYSDDYTLSRKKEGWVNAAEKLKQVKKDLIVLFHPFRYYMLYKINRVLELHINPMVMLNSTEKYKEMLNWEISHFQKWSSKSDFLGNISSWFTCTNLAIAAEPYLHETVFGSLSYPASIEIKVLRKSISQYWIKLKEYLSSLSKSQARDIQQEFCMSAELLDPNKLVHTMIRLMQGKERLNMKGKLGGSLVLITMAEYVRRAYEHTQNEEMREEDESGFGITPKDLKKELYGSNRLLDGNETAADEFLRQMGSNYGVRIRWYVEGDTEYGALRRYFGEHRAVEFINLRGQFIQRRGKGLIFIENLKNDLKSSIFSFISLDNDRMDNVRAVKKAAEENKFRGRFFIDEPDFEFANFNLGELEEILWNIAVKEGAKPKSREKLHESIRGIKNSKDLINSAKTVIPELGKFSKDRTWGKNLMDFAVNYPTLKDDGADESNIRPVIERIRYALRLMSEGDFAYYVKRKRVNSDTGVMERKT